MKEISAYIHDDFLGSPVPFAERFENIRVFEISDEMQLKAEKENIDWFEVWPELEMLVVYVRNNYSEKTVYERPQ